ncbi:MAG: hypothetical protein LKM44_01820 [Wolbachia endosymbiont of Meromenopon meropis]|nr:hypothetical protein [Wolbachia endosymbiont of Meromenopon meropis]
MQYKMISFFYRLRLLNGILCSLKDIIVRLFFLMLYLYISSVTLIFLNNGFEYAVKFSSFKKAFNHLFEYCKWYFYNKDVVTCEVYFKILVALFVPHFLYRLFFSISWKHFLKKKIAQIFKLMIRKREGRFKIDINSHNNCRNENSYSSEDYYNCNNAQRYAQEKQKVIMIRKLLLKDIEEVVDKRLNDIFFGERGSSH